MFQRKYKVLFDYKKEVKKDLKKRRIAVVMMLKNEEKRLQVTLDSLKNYVDSLIIYDTGSEDSTLDILISHCKSNQINLHVIQGEFIDFSTSRNVLLDWADTFLEIDYLLLMDCNDELKGGKELVKWVSINEKVGYKSGHSAWLLRQHWYSSEHVEYFNLRFIKSRMGWRYRGVVHEWLSNPNDISGGVSNTGKIENRNIVLFQDRTKDDDKTGKRFHRDKKLLLEENKKHGGKDLRTLFYLAQTYGCLNQHEEAMYYYMKRAVGDGFMEEKFMSLLRLVDCAHNLGHEWYDVFTWILKAMEVFPKRVEPLVKAAIHYQRVDNFELSWMFISRACELEYPTQSILFVDNEVYNYKRWHIMGIVAWYVGKYEQGMAACEKALNAKECRFRDIDESNLNLYKKKVLNL